MTYFRSLYILLELAGRLIVTVVLALLGCIILVAVAPLLAGILTADELERLLDV